MKNRNVIFVVLVALIFGLLFVASCNNTVPQQYQVTVKVLHDKNGDKHYTWVDYDEVNKTSRTTVFKGGKFARAIEPQDFEVDWSDRNQYAIFSFDGTTFSEEGGNDDWPASDKDKGFQAGERQSTFKGTINNTITLYAKYTIVAREKSAVELQGEVKGTRYVPITDTDPGMLTLRLNDTYSFGENIQGKIGATIPSTWTFNPVEGLTYTFDSLSEDNKVLKIKVTGTPLVIPEADFQHILVIPQEDVVNAVTEMQAQSGVTYSINTPTADASLQTISGGQFDDFTSSPRSLTITLPNGLQFDESRITIGEELGDKLSIYPMINGLKYTYGRLESGNTKLVIDITGVPLSSSTAQLTVSFQHSLFKNAKEDSVETVLANTTKTNYAIDLLSLSVSTTHLIEDENGSHYEIQGIWNVMPTNPEVITVSISSKATFKTKDDAIVKEGEDIPDSWLNNQKVQGLSYKIGSLTSDEMTINIESAPEFNSENTVPVYVDLRIPSTVISGVDVNSENSKVTIIPRGDIRYSISLPQANFAETNYGSRRKPIDLVTNIAVGNGDGVNVTLQLSEGLEFESWVYSQIVTNDTLKSNIKSWFSAFEKKFGSGFNYEIVAASSRDVTIKITGATNTTSIESNKSIAVSIPKEAIKNASASFSAINADLYYSTKSINISLNGAGSSTTRQVIVPLSAATDGSFRQEIQVKIQNGRFGSLTDDVFYKEEEVNGVVRKSGWFQGLGEYGNWKYTLTENGVDSEGNGYANITMTGTLTDLDEKNVSVILKVSPDDIKGGDSNIWNAYDTDNNLMTQLYFRIEGMVTATVEENEQYYGWDLKPLEAHKGVPFNNGNGYEIKINLSGANFIGQLTAEMVRMWFDSVSSYMELSETPKIMSGGSGENYIILNVKGSLKSASTGIAIFSLQIPKEHIDGSVKTYIPVAISYNCIGEVTARIDSSKPYYGSEGRAITGARFMPLNDGNGYEIRVVLDGAKFAKKDSDGNLIDLTDSDIGDWFSDFKSIRTPNYVIVEGGRANDNYIVINIKGELDTDSTILESFQLKITSSLITGTTEGAYITTDVYYKLSSTPGIALDAENDIYFGTEDKPIEGVNFIKFANKKIKISLTGGAKFVTPPQVGTYVNTWFENFTEISGGSYRVEESDYDFVIINISGAIEVDRNITEDNRVNSALISIPGSVIQGSLNEALTTSMYYKVLGNVEVVVDETGNYRGSLAKPITGVRNVSLSLNPDGTTRDVLVRFILNNSKFVNVGTKDSTGTELDVIKSWFSTFTDLNDLDVNIIDGGNNSDYILIRLDGSLTTTSNQPKKATLVVSPQYIEGCTAEAPLSVDIYYNITNEVTASFASSGDYYGSEGYPLLGVNGVKIESKNMLITFDGGVFGRTISGDDIKGWFSNVDGFDVSEATVTILNGGQDGDSDVAFSLEGGVINVDSDKIQDLQSGIIEIPQQGTIKNSESVDTIKVKFNFVAYREVFIEIDSGDDYRGDREDHAISGAPGNPLNDGEGYRIKINLYNGTFNTEDDNLYTSESLNRWFNNFTVLQDVDGNAKFTKEELTETSIIITVKGSLNSDVVGQSGSFDLEVPFDVIKGGKLQKAITEKVYYSVTDGVQFTIDTSDPYRGSDDWRIYGLPGIPVDTIDGSSQQVRINVINAKFKDIANGENVSSWFKNLAGIMTGSEFTVEEVGYKKDYVVVNVKGAFADLYKNTNGSMLLSIPNTALEGNTQINNDAQPTIYYTTGDKVGVKLREGSLGTANNPIVAYRNMTFSEDNPLLLTIMLDYNYGMVSSVKFASGITNDTPERVKIWFNRWPADGYANDQGNFSIVEGGAGSNTVVIKITNLAFLSTPGEDKSIEVRIPASDIDASLTEDLSFTLYFKTSEEIKATISSSSEYDGGYDENHPIVGNEYVELGSGDGVLMRIELPEDVKFKGVTPGDTITTWLNSDTNINTNINDYSLSVVSGGTDESYAVVRLKGAIVSTPGVSHKATFKIPADKVENFLESASDLIEGTFYYKAEAAPEAAFDKSGGYVGADTASPLIGTQFIALKDGSGYEARINLTNALFSSALSEENVRVWFSELDKKMTNSEYTITQGGKKQSYVVVRIKGNLTEAKTSNVSSLQVSIPASDLYKVDTSMKNIVINFYYWVSSVVSVYLDDTNSIYYGTTKYPIMDIRGVDLNEGNGYLIKINLQNGNFRSEIASGTSVSSWFTGFTDLTSGQFIVEDGGNGNNYVIVRVKGILREETPDNGSATITIAHDAIEGVLDKGVTAEIKYGVTAGVTATLNTASNYYGSLSNKLSEVQYVALNDKAGYDIRIDLKNGKFISSLDKDVSSWFKAFTFLIGSESGNTSDPNYIERSMTIIDGGAGKNYAIIRIRGALTSTPPVSGNSSLSANIAIPRSVIVGTLDKDLVVPLFYETTGKVGVSLESDNDTFVGATQEKALSGVQYVPLNYVVKGDADGEGFIVKINLTNAKFVQDEYLEPLVQGDDDLIATKKAARIEKWFQEFLPVLDKDSAQFILEAGGSGQNYAFVKIKGHFMISDNDGNCNIIIPQSDVDALLPAPLVTTFHYKSAGQPAVVVNSDIKFVGTMINPLEEVTNVKFTTQTSGSTEKNDGVLIRLELNGSVFKNGEGDRTFPEVNAETQFFDEWFEDLNASGNFKQVASTNTYSTREVNDGTNKLQVTLEQGGVNENYIVLKVQGAFAKEVKNLTSSSIRIPRDLIVGTFKTDLRAPFYYRTKNTVTASFDNTGSYYGSPVYPIEGFNQIWLGGSYGLDAYGKPDQTGGVDIMIKLGNAKFKNDASLFENEKVTEWFQTTDEKNNNSGVTTLLDGAIIGSTTEDASGVKDVLPPKVTVKTGGGGAGEDYIMLRLHGAFHRDFDTTENENKYKKVSIPANVIDNAELSDNVEVVINLRSLGNVTASLSSASGFYGVDKAPIEGIEGFALNNGSGYNIRVQLSDNSITFKNMDAPIIKTMFESLAASGKGATDGFMHMDLKNTAQGIDTTETVADKFKVTLINGGAGYSYAEFNIKGVIGSEATFGKETTGSTSKTDSKAGYGVLVFSSEHINNYVDSNDNIKAYVTVLSHPSHKVTVALENSKDPATGLQYYGSEDYPIKAIPYTALGENGEGVSIKLTLKLALQDGGYDVYDPETQSPTGTKIKSNMNIRFSEKLNTDTVTNWFKGLEWNDADPDPTKHTGYGRLSYQIASGGVGNDYLVVRVTGYPCKTGVTTKQKRSIEMQDLIEIAGLFSATGVNLQVYVEELPEITVQRVDDWAALRYALGLNDDGSQDPSIELSGSRNLPIVGPLKLSTTGMYVGLILNGGDATTGMTDANDSMSGNIIPMFNSSLTNAYLDKFLKGYIFSEDSILISRIVYGGPNSRFVVFEYDNTTPAGVVIGSDGTVDNPTPRNAQGEGRNIRFDYYVIKNAVDEMSVVDEMNVSKAPAMPDLYYMAIGSVSISILTDAKYLNIMKTIGAGTQVGNRESTVDIPKSLRFTKGTTYTKGGSTYQFQYNGYYNTAEAGAKNVDEGTEYKNIKFSDNGASSETPLKFVNYIQMYDLDAEANIALTLDGNSVTDTTIRDEISDARDLSDGIDVVLLLENTSFSTTITDDNIRSWFNNLFSANPNEMDEIYIAINRNITTKMNNNRSFMDGVYTYQNPHTRLLSSVLYLKITGATTGNTLQRNKQFTLNISYPYIGNGKNESIGVISTDIYYERVNPSLTFVDQSGYYGSQSRPIRGAQYAFLGGAYNTGVKLKAQIANAKLAKTGGTSALNTAITNAFMTYENLPHPNDGINGVPAYTNTDYEGSSVIDYLKQNKLWIGSDGKLVPSDGTVIFPDAQGVTRDTYPFTLKGAPRFRTFTGPYTNVTSHYPVTVRGQSVKGMSPTGQLVAELYWTIGRPELSTGSGDVFGGRVKSLIGFRRKAYSNTITTDGGLVYGNVGVQNESFTVIPHAESLSGVLANANEFLVQTVNGQTAFTLPQNRYYLYANGTGYSRANPEFYTYVMDSLGMRKRRRSWGSVGSYMYFSFPLNKIIGFSNYAAVADRNLIGNAWFHDQIYRFDMTYSIIWNGNITVRHRGGGKMDFVQFRDQVEVSWSTFKDIVGLGLDGSDLFVCYWEQNKFIYMSIEGFFKKFGGENTFKNTWIIRTYSDGTIRVGSDMEKYASYMNKEVAVSTYSASGYLKAGISSDEAYVKFERKDDKYEKGNYTQLFLGSENDSRTSWEPYKDPITVYAGWDFPMAYPLVGVYKGWAWYYTTEASGGTSAFDPGIWDAYCNRHSFASAPNLEDINVAVGTPAAFYVPYANHAEITGDVK